MTTLRARADSVQSFHAETAESAESAESAEVSCVHSYGT